MSRTVRTHLLFAAVVAAFAALALLLAPSTAEAMQETSAPVAAPAVLAAEGITAEDEILTAALGAGADYSAEQRTEILLTADRVCEGITAAVPLVDMAAHVSEVSGLGDTEARNFVTVVARVHC